MSINLNLLKIIPAIVFAIASMVIVGWGLHVPELVQIKSGWVPMQIWTAIGFLITSVACICERFRKYLGLVLLALGGLVLSEYMLGFNFSNFDTFWGDPWCVTNTSHPGRMAPPTALSFLFIGISFIFKKFKQGLLVLSGFLGTISLIAYQTGLKWYAWGLSTHMAAHTALCFCAIAYYLLEETAHNDN